MTISGLMVERFLKVVAASQLPLLLNMADMRAGHMQLTSVVKMSSVNLCSAGTSGLQSFVFIALTWSDVDAESLSLVDFHFSLRY